MAQPFVEPCSRGVIEAQPCPRELGREISPQRRRMVLAACILASSMAFIDASALTVALPRLRAAVGADLASVQWVLNGYVLALASLTLIGGALADTYGKARMLAIGCLLFGAASVGCAAAPSVAWLIAARVVQGIAAALVTPASLALIGAIYPKEERNRAIGVWAAASALTTAGGPGPGRLADRDVRLAGGILDQPAAGGSSRSVSCGLTRPWTGSRRAGSTWSVRSIVAAALGALAWALSQIGRGEAGTAASSGRTPTIVARGRAWLRRPCPLRALGALDRPSDDAAAAGAEPRLPGAQRRDPAGLCRGLRSCFSCCRSIWSTGADCHRPLPDSHSCPSRSASDCLSRLFGSLADTIGARAMLIAGPLGAALAYAWMALGQDASLLLGVIGPMTLLGISFAVLVAPLTASVMSSVQPADEGLASGINNAASRVAQLAGVAVAAGVGSLAVRLPARLVGCRCRLGRRRARDRVHGAAGAATGRRHSSPCDRAGCPIAAPQAGNMSWKKPCIDAHESFSARAL